jgi:hypothetical protein
MRSVLQGCGVDQSRISDPTKLLDDSSLQEVTRHLAARIVGGMSLFSWLANLAVLF